MQMPGIPSLLQQAMGCATSYAEAMAEISEQSKRYTPHPGQFKPGIRNGSITSKVKEILETQNAWLEHCELMRLTGGSRGAISWAIRYLAAHGMVRSIPSARHPNYLRYRIVLVKE